jgi:hypothetical protein
MSSLLVRRLIVYVVGFTLGAIVSAAFVILVLPWLGPNDGNPIPISKYGYQYFFWTAFPLGVMFVIWLDYFLDTKILPD